jgi:class 3 adenylate cyclase
VARENEAWAGIIRAIKAPIGFFALVVLCIEAILSLVALQVDRTTAMPVIYAMAGVLVLVVISVLIIAVRPSMPVAITPTVDRRAVSKETSQPAVTEPANEKHHLSDYEVLQHKIADYADKHRSCRLVVANGERIIKKGDRAEHLFLLEEGNLIIDDETGRPREEKELKYPGSIVGEAAVVGSNRRRTASVYVYSAQARLVRMSREAILDLVAYDSHFETALQYLVKLHASRLEKIAIYCGHGVDINTDQCTVLMGDIHGYTRLSEMVTDEMACPFRFKFTEQSYETATRNKGFFEDQGDGYKVFFRGPDHAVRAMTCALELKWHYAELVEEFARYDDAFKEIGLGIGLASDNFTVVTKPNRAEKILGHSINIAAALCKLRDVPNEIRIYCMTNVINQVDRSAWSLEGPIVRAFDKLQSRPEVFILHDKAQSTPTRLHPLSSTPAATSRPVQAS